MIEVNTLTKNLILTPFNLLYKISPELDLKILFRLKVGHKLHLKNPVTYNEKLQWIKLYDKNPLMPKCCDKYMVREFVTDMGCADILNELYWYGDDPDDIPYDKLPEKFVIKITHGSTFNILVKDKAQLNRRAVSQRLKKWLNTKYIPCYGEWFYGKVKPRIVIEKYLEDKDSGELPDYKVFCFNGKAGFIQVDSGRFGDHRRNIYDLGWKFLEKVSIQYPQGKTLKKPEVLPELLKYAEILSSKFYHARVDFFIVDGKIYFGEITFTHGAGFERIVPYEFGVKMGNMLKLPLA